MILHTKYSKLSEHCILMFQKKFPDKPFLSCSCVWEEQRNFSPVFISTNRGKGTMVLRTYSSGTSTNRGNGTMGLRRYSSGPTPSACGDAPQPAVIFLASLLELETMLCYKQLFSLLPFLSLRQFSTTSIDFLCFGTHTGVSSKTVTKRQLPSILES